MMFARCFFVQAEDGIRDLVRSRGLGDVYKRQLLDLSGRKGLVIGVAKEQSPAGSAALHFAQAGAAVSYTHLTLPTSDLV